MIDSDENLQLDMNAFFTFRKIMSSAAKEIEISKVNPQQLQQLHQQLEQEIQNLSVSYQTLQTVHSKYVRHS